MNDTIIVAIISAVAPILAVLFAWYSHKRAIKEVHYLINSRMTELLEVSKAKSRAEGVKQGRNEK